MKSTNQVRSHRSAAASAQQAKTPDDEIALMLFNYTKGEVIAGVDLTGAEFDAIQERAGKLQINLEQMLCEGVAQMIKVEKLTAVLNRCLVTGAAWLGGVR